MCDEILPGSESGLPWWKRRNGWRQRRRPPWQTLQAPSRHQTIAYRTAVIAYGKNIGARLHPSPDPVLIKLIANAQRWWHDLMIGRYLSTRALAHACGKDECYVARVLRLAFLAPKIVDAIVTGQQPAALTAQRLMTLRDLSYSWKCQTAALSFDCSQQITTFWNIRVRRDNTSKERMIF
jgi:hypothetical protein